MTADQWSSDQSAVCGNACRHELAPGVLVEALLGGDGPYLTVPVQPGGVAHLTHIGRDAHTTQETLAA